MSLRYVHLTRAMTVGWFIVAASSSASAWTWVDVAGTRCGISSNVTGLGYQLAEPATPLNSKLFIYMDGGGSCNSMLSCSEDSGGAANIKDGYDATKFESGLVTRYFYLKEENSSNPFYGMNRVFIPYCTGDLHVGTRGTVPFDGVYFQGAVNLDLDIAKIASILDGRSDPAGITEVWLLGTSAGGGGANLQYKNIRNKLRQKYPGAKVHLIEDSSPGVPNTGTEDQDNQTAWGFNFWCSNCASASDVRVANRALDKIAKFGLLSFEYDYVTANELRGMPGQFSDFLNGIKAQMDSAAVSNPPSPSRMFRADNTQIQNYTSSDCRAHVVTFKNAPPSLASAHRTWISNMVNNPSAWVDTSVPVAQVRGCTVP